MGGADYSRCSIVPHEWRRIVGDRVRRVTSPERDVVRETSVDQELSRSAECRRASYADGTVHRVRRLDRRVHVGFDVAALDVCILVWNV